ncbi:MAG: amidohydrolase family protein [Planctomycetes bacterium]|nr:amidohydrolase family protein [Planctomycetota bacterium]
MRLASHLALACAGLCLTAVTVGAAPRVVRGRVHTAAGATIDRGAVVFEGAQITWVGPFAELQLPEGAEVLDLADVELTPGLIDAAVPAGDGSVEDSSEVVPHLKLADALSLSGAVWQRLAQAGVTTVYVTSNPASVVGSQGTLVGTGKQPELLPHRGDVKLTLSNEAWRRGRSNGRPFRDVARLTARRPNTRMGLIWVLREALLNAQRGVDDPASKALAATLAGAHGLRVHARQRHDLETALRLADEFGIRRLVFEEATEAYHAIDLLRGHDVVVIYGPMFMEPLGSRARTGEAEHPCLRTPLMLHEAQIPFCLTAADRLNEGLAEQAMWAMRYGLPFEAALQAVTASPAQLLGIAERTGTLQVGKRADLVVWSGRPFASTSKPLLVLRDGRAVYRDAEHVENAAWDEASPGGAAQPPKKPQRNF